jgi:hypothetical protein
VTEAVAMDSSEKKLLLASVKQLLEPSDRQFLCNVIDAGLDWDYVFKTGGRHGLLPLLFYTINETGIRDKIPENIYENLRRSYLSTLLKNQQLIQTFEPILESFSSHDIPVMLLKGPALCMTIYEDMALRPFADIDILVHKKDVKQCQKIMDEQEFVIIRDQYFPIPDDQNDELGCEWSYHRHGQVVELHWDLLNRLEPFQVDISRFWEHAIQIDLKGKPVSIMDPTSQLSHLCLHQYRHHWMYMRDLLDVAIMLDRKRDEIDWERLVIDSKQQGFGRCIYYTVMLSHQLLGIDIDDVPMAKILGRHKPNLLARSMKDLIADNIFEVHMPRRFWDLILVEGATNRATIIKNTLAHPFPRRKISVEEKVNSKASRKEKFLMAVGSAFYYKRLLVEFSRNILKKFRRQ